MAHNMLFLFSELEEEHILTGAQVQTNVAAVKGKKEKQNRNK